MRLEVFTDVKGSGKGSKGSVVLALLVLGDGKSSHSGEVVDTSVTFHCSE